MVIDFGILKEKIGGWIDKNWDHGFILWDQDIPGTTALNFFEDKESELLPSGQGFVQKVYGLPNNPTAENLAAYLLDLSNQVLLKDTGVTIVEVTLWETENCFATAKQPR